MSLSASCFKFDTDYVDSLHTPLCIYDMDDFPYSDAQDESVADKTPFHEWDSGLSDTSAVSKASSTCSGVSPAREMDVMLDELLDSAQFRPFSLPDSCNGQQDIDFEDCFRNRIDPDTEFDFSVATLSPASQQANQQSVGTISAAVQLNPVDCGLIGGIATVSVAIPKNKHQFQACLSASSEDLMPISARTRSRSHLPANRETTLQDIDEDMEDDECSVEKSCSPGSNVSCASTQNSLNPKPTLNSVKVVRVVRTQHELPNTPDEVVKALEERNRKNAEQAKANRLRKKNYVVGLENKVKEQKQLIIEFKKRLEDALEENSKLKTEVEYLKAVLSNQSALADLLKNIPNAQNVQLSSSIVSRKRTSAEIDHNYTPSKKQCLVSQPQPKAGVCLHVASDSVSLEFCHHCSEMAHMTSELV